MKSFQFRYNLHLEGTLGIAFTHTLASTAAALNASKDAIHILCATPFLVCENITTKIAFATLHQVDIGQHTISLEALRELIRDGCGAVKTSKRDQLQDESVPLLVHELKSKQNWKWGQIDIPFLSKVPDKALELLFAETMAHPVEARAQVVHQLFAWVHTSDLLREACSLLYARITSLKPEEVGVRRKCDGALGRCGKSRTVVVEAFTRSRDIPAELYGRTSN